MGWGDCPNRDQRDGKPNPWFSHSVRNNNSQNGGRCNSNPGRNYTVSYRRGPCFRVFRPNPRQHHSDGLWHGLWRANQWSSYPDPRGYFSGLYGSNSSQGSGIAKSGVYHPNNKRCRQDQGRRRPTAWGDLRQVLLTSREDQNPNEVDVQRE
jgi:hypothetical protein